MLLLMINNFFKSFDVPRSSRKDSLSMALQMLVKFSMKPLESISDVTSDILHPTAQNLVVIH